MKGFVVLGVYRSTVKKQNKEKTLLCFYVYLNVEFTQFLKSSYCHVSVIIKIFS